MSPSGPVFWGLRVNLLWGSAKSGDVGACPPVPLLPLTEGCPGTNTKGTVGGFPLLSRSTMWLHGKILLLIGDVALESIEDMHKDTAKARP